MIDEPIRIAGAGIAGISAAITLARLGHQVEVCEQGPTHGHRYHGDFQGIINWAFKDDALTVLRRIGIDIDFPVTPMSEAIIHDSRGHAFTFRSRQPLFYIVKRGPAHDTLDAGIRAQAERLGVQFRWRQRLDHAAAAIVATGPRRIDALDLGYLFETSHPNCIASLLDDRIAPKFYAYLVVVDGEATCATVMAPPFHHARERLAAAWETFNRLYALRPQRIRLWSGFGNFGPAVEATGSVPYVGEAGGLQDVLFGAGMHYAFLSGHLAGRSLHEGSSYYALAQEHLHPSMRALVSNRFGYELLGNLGYGMMLRAGALFRDIAPFLRSFYRGNPLTAAAFPFARAYLAWRYPRAASNATGVGNRRSLGLRRAANRGIELMRRGERRSPVGGH